MKVIGVVGASGSGKTTTIVALIASFIEQGLTVGAIKHTHHAVNDDDRGDSAAFRNVGALPVILAGDREAVIFYGDAKARISYDDPHELLERFRNDIVFVEGFKTEGTWPRIELNKSERRTIQEIAEIVDRIVRP